APPRPPLFPYTTLFRSCPAIVAAPALTVPPCGLAETGADVSAASPNASARLPRSTVPAYRRYFSLCAFSCIPPVWRRKVKALIKIGEHTSELQSPYDLV